METLESSSIVKWGYQDNFKPVYFFYEKILRAQKHSQAKQNKIKGNNFSQLRG